MNNSIGWTESDEPIGLSVDQLLYRIRQRDTDGLIFDSVTMGDVLGEDGVERYALDALVFTYSLLAKKMNILKRTMDRAGGDMDVMEAQVSDPFKRNGVAQVAAIFELSDGQTVTVYFHNPDSTPGRLAPKDQMVSWKWLLNKRDITIVVAPERGNDIAIREVARRVMKLATKNSAAFAKSNAKRAERLENISSMKEEISTLEIELTDLNRQIEVIKVEKESEALKPKFSAADGMKALESIKKFIGRAQYRTLSKAMRGEEKSFFVDKARLLADIINGMAETYEQDGKGMDATAYLHYFKSGSDWYITEKDMQGGTQQAFGYADHGRGGGEMGYISIDEITQNDAELDLYFDPQALKAATGKEGEGEEKPEANEDKLLAARAMVATVSSEFGGSTPNWTRDKDSTSLWDFTDLVISSLTLRIGVSSGGVISVDGKPHDPEGRVIDSLESLRATIAPLIPAEMPAWEGTKESVTAMDEDDFKAEVVDLDNNNLRSQSLLLLAKRKGTDEQVAEAQSIIDAHDAAGHAEPEMIERREALRQLLNNPEVAAENTSDEAAEVVADIDEARAATDTDPTEQEKEDSSYAKGELNAFGLDLVIENPKGSIRSKKNATGDEWSVSMAHDYGYIKGTLGVDGDEVDMFVGPNQESETAYVINQVNLDGNLDEHKVMLGFNDEEGARQGYLSSFKPGWDGLGSVREMTLDELKAWLPSAAGEGKKTVNQEVVDTKAPANEDLGSEPLPDLSQVKSIADVDVRGGGTPEERAQLFNGIKPNDSVVDINGDQYMVFSKSPHHIRVTGKDGQMALKTVDASYFTGDQDAVKTLMGMPDRITQELLAERQARKEAAEDARPDVPFAEPEVTVDAPQPELDADLLPSQQTQITKLDELRKLAPKSGETIKSDDPDAIEKLTAKLEYLQGMAKMMRDANKLVRKTDTEGLKRMGLNDESVASLLKPDFAGRSGFARYQMSNNSAEVGRTKRRLDQLIRERDAAVVEPAIEPAPIAEPTPTNEPTVEAQPMPEVQPEAIPEAEENQSPNSDLSFLESVINGTVQDVLSPELGEQIAEVLERNIDNEAMTETLERAVMAYQAAMETATAEL